MSEHRTHVERVIPQPWSRTRYRAWCECKKYESRVFNFPGQAERAGEDHVRAKA